MNPAPSHNKHKVNYKIKSKRPKRIVIISDPHCGGRAGLTPPAWNNIGPNDHWRKIRRDFWKEFNKLTINLQPVDGLIINGDMLDGPSNLDKEDFFIDALTLDRTIQTEMAIRIVRSFNAQSIIMVRGTSFHSGGRDNWEEDISREVGAISCSTRQFINVNGVVFSFKHKVNASSIPHGMFTAPAKPRVWNLVAADEGTEPRADILVRSHTHTFAFCGNHRYLTIVTPGLQGSTRYGEAQVDRTVHWGMIWFDISPSGKYTWDYIIVIIDAEKAEVIEI